MSTQPDEEKYTEQYLAALKSAAEVAYDLIDSLAIQYKMDSEDVANLLVSVTGNHIGAFLSDETFREDLDAYKDAFDQVAVAVHEKRHERKAKQN